MREIVIEDVTITFSDTVITVNTPDETFVQNIHKKQVFRNDSGESVIELSGLACEDKREDRSWAYAFYERDGQSQLHYHTERTENYYVVKGVARVIVNNVIHDLCAGQTITITPEQIHQVISIGEEPLEMIVRCSPAWVVGDQHFLNLPDVQQFKF